MRILPAFLCACSGSMWSILIVLLGQFKSFGHKERGDTKNPCFEYLFSVVFVLKNLLNDLELQWKSTT